MVGVVDGGLRMVPLLPALSTDDAREVRQQSVTMAKQKFAGGTVVGQARA